MSESLWDKLRAELQFLDIARNESRRTVLAQPDFVDRLRWHLDQAGIDPELVTVLPGPFIPPDMVIVMDQQAIEASTAEAIQHLMRPATNGDRP